MRKVIVPILAATIAMVMASASVAAPAVQSTVKARSSVTAPAEQPALQRLDALCKASTGLSYQAHVSVSAPGATGAAKVATEYDVIATFQKPNLLSLSVSQSGKEVGRVVCGPTTCAVFDPAGNQYSSFAAPSDWSGIVTGVFHHSPPSVGEAVVSSIDTIEKYNTTFAIFGSSSMGTATSSTLTATLNGKAVTDVRQVVTVQNVHAVCDTDIDPSTNLPVKTSMTIKSGGQGLLMTETYAAFQTSSTPAADSTFAFTPPTGAKVYTPPAAAAAAEPEEKPVLANGKPAPDFAVLSPTGKTVHLSDYKGRVVVIDFWSTWCGPCQDSLPGTDKIAGAYQPKGVKFLPVCTWDQKPAFQSWVAKRKAWNMNFYFDPASSNDNSIAAKLYSVSGIPTQFVIGKDGKIVMSNIGDGGQESEAQLKQALNKALATTD